MKYKIKPCARSKKGGAFYGIYAIFPDGSMWLEKVDESLFCVKLEDFEIRPVRLWFD